MLLRRLLLAALCLAGSFTAWADSIPTIDFFKHEQFQTLVISPKGDYLAAVAPDDVRPRVVIIKIADMSLSGMVNMPPGEQAWDLFWVNDDRLVFDTVKASFTLSGKLAMPEYTGQIYSANAKGQDVRELHTTSVNSQNSSEHGDTTPYYLKRPIPNSDNSVLILIFDQEDDRGGGYRYYRSTINRINVMTGNREQLAAPPSADYDYLTDANGVVRYIASEDEHGQLITQYHAAKNDDWITLSTEPSRGHHNVPLGFSQDLSHVYLGTGTGVYLVDLNTKERQLVSKVVDAKSVITGTDMVTPIGLYTEPDYPAMEFFDPKSPDAQLMRDLSKSFKGDRIYLTSFSKDGKRGVVLRTSDVNPGEYFLVDLDKSQVTSLLKVRPWIDPAKMAPKEAIRLKARDGTTLNGYVTVPRGAPEKNLPLVVLVHGGPHGPRDEWDFENDVQFYANRGYAVLQVNYRGSGGYGEDFKAAGYKHWGTTMQDDVTDATLWAIKDGLADPKRICIAGGSYGGYSALMGVIREPDLYRCAFAYDGIYDLPMMFKNGDTPESVQGINYLTDVLGTDQQDLRNRSPVFNVDKIKVPLFLAHGKEDLRAPYAQYLELTAALDKAGKHYDSLVKSREEHGFYDPKNRVELYDKVAAFLAQNIGPGVGQAAPAAATAAASPAAAPADPAAAK